MSEFEDEMDKLLIGSLGLTIGSIADYIPSEDPRLKMPVHCCCSAKLLGHVPVPQSMVKRGRELTFAQHGGGTLKMDVQELGRSVGGHLAVRSKDYPLEEIYKIKGFEPHVTYDDHKAAMARINERLAGLAPAAQAPGTAIKG